MYYLKCKVSGFLKQDFIFVEASNNQQVKSKDKLYNVFLNFKEENGKHLKPIYLNSDEKLKVNSSLKSYLELAYEKGSMIIIFVSVKKKDNMKEYEVTDIAVFGEESQLA